jgi:hypothetical protein
MTHDEPSANPERGIVTVDHPMLADTFRHPIVPVRGCWLGLLPRRAAPISDRRIALNSGDKARQVFATACTGCAFECTLNPASRNDTMRFAVTSDGGVIAEGSLLLQQTVAPPR